MSGTATNLIICPSGPEEEGLSPSSSSHKEEHDLDIVTMTTASHSQQKGGPVIGTEGVGESRRRMRREGETKHRTGGGREGPPDLDLDLVEEEAQEEERRRKSHRARQKEKLEDQREKKVGSRSSTHPGEASPLEPDGAGVERRRRRRSEVARGQREKEARRSDKGEKTASHAEDSGSSAPAQRSAFSFLRPMDDGDHHEDRERMSDNESTSSFSEASLSAASIATAGWREDWGAASPWEQSRGPGPWLKPSPERLTEALGNRLDGHRLVGGLSL